MFPLYEQKYTCINLLPPAYVVNRKVMFSVMSVCHFVHKGIPMWSLPMMPLVSHKGTPLPHGHLKASCSKLFTGDLFPFSSIVKRAVDVWLKGLLILYQFSFKRSSSLSPSEQLKPSHAGDKTRKPGDSPWLWNQEQKSSWILNRDTNELIKGHNVLQNL